MRCDTYRSKNEVLSLSLSLCLLRYFDITTIELISIRSGHQLWNFCVVIEHAILSLET